MASGWLGESVDASFQPLMITAPCHNYNQYHQTPGPPLHCTAVSQHGATWHRHMGIGGQFGTNLPLATIDGHPRRTKTRGTRLTRCSKLVTQNCQSQILTNVINCAHLANIETGTRGWSQGIVPNFILSYNMVFNDFALDKAW